jgi:hypothetical protein
MPRDCSPNPEMFIAAFWSLSRPRPPSAQDCPRQGGCAKRRVLNHRPDALEQRLYADCI